ncbi:hypothetical protein D3C80_519750 [compost metagenome]
MGRGLADNHRALLDQPAHNGSVRRRYMADIGSGAIAGFDALGIDQILDPDRQAFQGAGTACGIFAVTFCRGLQCLVRCNRCESIDLALARFGVGQGVVHQFHGTDVPGRQCVPRLAQPGRPLCEVVHERAAHQRLSNSRSSLPAALLPKSSTSFG